MSLSHMQLEKTRGRRDTKVSYKLLRWKTRRKGNSRLIIGIRFQVGKFISAVLYGRERESSYRVWWHLMWFTHLKPSRLMHPQSFLYDNKLRWEGSWSQALVSLPEVILFLWGPAVSYKSCVIYLLPMSLPLSQNACS